MFLCVDTRALKKSPEIQKDVDLEDIINNHTKYYDDEEKAYKDYYAPLDFCVSVRSTYSNLVLEKDKGALEQYYTHLTKIAPYSHKGYDLIMYLCSIGLMQNIDYALGFDDLMMKHSQFQPIGLYNLGSPLFNPVIYSHVIMSDEGAEELKKYLKDGTRLVPIRDINRKGNLNALLKTLIEVKEEN